MRLVFRSNTLGQTFEICLLSIVASSPQFVMLPTRSISSPRSGQGKMQPCTNRNSNIAAKSKMSNQPYTQVHTSEALDTLLSVTSGAGTSSSERH